MVVADVEVSILKLCETRNNKEARGGGQKRQRGIGRLLLFDPRVERAFRATEIGDGVVGKAAGRAVVARAMAVQFRGPVC